MTLHRVSGALLLVAGVATLISAALALGGRSDDRLVEVGRAALRADLRAAHQPGAGGQLVYLAPPQLEPLLSHLRGWTSILYAMNEDEMQQLGAGVCADDTCSEDADVEVLGLDRTEHLTSRALLEHDVDKLRPRVVELARDSRASFGLWAVRIVSGFACLLLAIALRRRWPSARTLGGFLGIVLLAETAASALTLRETLYFLGYLGSTPRTLAELAALGFTAIAVPASFATLRRSK